MSYSMLGGQGMGSAGTGAGAGPRCAQRIVAAGHGDAADDGGWSGRHRGYPDLHLRERPLPGAGWQAHQWQG